MNTTDFGRMGEKIAHDYLAGKGFAIVKSNLHIGRNEVDILARGANCVLVVEVKTRKDDHPDRDFAINRNKIRHLSRAADLYIRSLKLPFEARIDAITILFHADGSHTLEHLEDITLPPLRSRR